MKPLANGRERDQICSCEHGPAVHRDNRCVFQAKCGCAGWRPVPYVYDTEVCSRCVELEAELNELRATIPNVVPRQRQPLPSEQHLVAGVRRARLPQRFHE